MNTEADLTPLTTPHNSPEKPLKLRNSCVREYASVLVDDSGLWRMAIDYLGTIGPSAKRKMSNIVLNIPFALDGENDEDAVTAEEGTEMDDASTAADGKGKGKAAGEAAGDRRFKLVEDRLRACVDHNMEEEARAICKVRQSHASSYNQSVA